MFSNFSPFSFIFLRVYFMILRVLLFTPNFFIFWVVIEFIMLLFIGLSYSLFRNRFSSLMLFFLLQTFSSFGLLIFFIFENSFFFTLFFLIKLSMFPFHFWVIGVSYRFPNFPLLLSLTLHKLPVFLMVTFFHISLDPFILWTSVVASVLISGYLILSTSDLRLALIASSVGNNSWFLLRCLVGSRAFFIFLFVYSLLLSLTFVNLGVLSKELLHFNTNGPFICLLLVSISGLPPFPLFFVKIAVLLQLFTLSLSRFFSFLFLVGVSLMLAGYVRLIFKHLIYKYSSRVSIACY